MTRRVLLTAPARPGALRFERDFLGAALARHHGSISTVAEETGMYRQELQQKLAALGIDAERYRRSEGK